MKHITQTAICQLSNHGLFSIGLSGRSFMRRPVDAACDNVVFCNEYGAGVYYVLDCSGAGARREIDHDAPPQ